jgi:hypothetical protein
MPATPFRHAFDILKKYTRQAPKLMTVAQFVYSPFIRGANKLLDYRREYSFWHLLG